MTRAMGEDQILALALEGRVHAAQGETAELVALAGNLALLPDPEIDPAFAAMLEEQILSDGILAPHGTSHIQGARLSVVKPAEATPAEPVRQNVVQLPRRRLVVRRSLVGIAVAASLAAFPLAMAANSLPGSPFYGLKHFMERTWDARPGSTMAHAFRHLGRANEHLDEAQQLSAGGNKDAADDALKMAQDEMNDAKDLFALDKSNPVDASRFNSFLTSTEVRLQKIENDLAGPPATTPTLVMPVAAPNARVVEQAPARSNNSVTVADTTHTTKKTTDDTIDQTAPGSGDGIHQVEGCHPPLQSELDQSALQSGDTLAFMCRTGIGVTEG